MPFDPKSYLAEKTQGTSGNFNPQAYLSQKLGKVTSSPPEEEPGQLEALTRGTANSASFGFAPSITGALEATPKALDALSGQGGMADILAAYNKAREESKAKYDAAEKAHPYTSLAGGVAGGLIPALLTGGASAVESGIGGAMGMGAKIGGLSGLGHSVSSGEGLQDTVKDTLSGAGSGALVGGALHGAGKLLSGTPEFLESEANNRALKSTGMGKAQVKNLIQQDVRSNAFTGGDQNSIQKIGSLLLEKNPYQEEAVVSKFATPEVVLQRTSDLADKAGNHIAEILGKMDESFNSENPAIISKFFNPSTAASEIENQLLVPLKVNGNIPPLSKPIAGTIQNVLDTVNQYGNNPIPFAKAQELKQLITGLTTYESEGSPTQQVLRRAGGIINKAIEDSADDVVKNSGQMELNGLFKQAKNYYGAAKTAETAAIGKTAGNMVNRDFGITDYMSGVAGAAAHGTPGVAVGMVANKVAKSYGNPFVANMANSAAKGTKAISNQVSDVTKSLTSLPKEAIVSYGQSLTQNPNPLAQKLGNILTGAGERDDIGRNALIFSLMQNSGYREFLTNHFGGNNNGTK